MEAFLRSIHVDGKQVIAEARIGSAAKAIVDGGYASPQEIVGIELKIFREDIPSLSKGETNAIVSKANQKSGATPKA